MEKGKNSGAHFEVERKFRLSPTEFASMQAQLAQFGFTAAVTSVITDTMLPDGGKSNTCRIRREQVLVGRECGVRFYFTRKEQQKLPNGGSVRKESESAIKAAQAERRIARAISSTGSPLPSYSKSRRTFKGNLGAYEATIALDQAQGLGAYSGCYMEVEVILPLGSAKVQEVQSQIGRFAEKLLGEERPGQISYFKMLLLSWAEAAINP